MMGEKKTKTIVESHARIVCLIKCVSPLQLVVIWPQNILLVVFVFKVIKCSMKVALENDMCIIDS